MTKYDNFVSWLTGYMDALGHTLPAHLTKRIHSMMSKIQADKDISSMHDKYRGQGEDYIGKYVAKNQLQIASPALPYTNLRWDNTHTGAATISTSTSSNIVSNKAFIADDNTNQN